MIIPYCYVCGHYIPLKEGSIKFSGDQARFYCGPNGTCYCNPTVGKKDE
jgi:hypothetical protein